MADTMCLHHDSEKSLNRFIKNMIAGMGTILVISPVARAEDLNIDDYMHHSASEAVHSDWMKVGQGLTDSASDVNSKQKRVEQAS